jgi:hypothetical protein
MKGMQAIMSSSQPATCGTVCYHQLTCYVGSVTVPIKTSRVHGGVWHPLKLEGLGKRYVEVYVIAINAGVQNSHTCVVQLLHCHKRPIVSSSDGLQCKAAGNQNKHSSAAWTR